MFNLIPWKGTHDDARPSTTLAADPFEKILVQFREEMDSALARFWNNWAGWGNRLQESGFGWSLSMDETDDAYEIRAEAPGFDPDDFEVDVRGNYLNIRAEHKEEERNGNEGCRYQYGRFQRSTQLPPGVDAEKISARYHSGVLELHIPKNLEFRGKRITVQAK